MLEPDSLCCKYRRWALVLWRMTQNRGGRPYIHLYPHLTASFHLQSKTLGVPGNEALSFVHYLGQRIAVPVPDATLSVAILYSLSIKLAPSKLRLHMLAGTAFLIVSHKMERYLNNI